MDHDLILSYLKLIIPVFLVILGAWLALRKYSKEKNDKKELIVNVVYGDLANIWKHYYFSKNELHLLLVSDEEKLIRLRFFQFGQMLSLEKLDQLGNLSAYEIRELLQLNLRIRNTDLILQDMFDGDTKINKPEIHRLKSRMELCSYSAYNLMASISKYRNELKKDFIQLESMQ